MKNRRSSSCNNSNNNDFPVPDHVIIPAGGTDEEALASPSKKARRWRNQPLGKKVKCIAIIFFDVILAGMILSIGMLPSSGSPEWSSSKASSTRLAKRKATGALADISRFQSCRYDGHCPVGSSCSAVPASLRGKTKDLGYCEPIPSKGEHDPASIQLADFESHSPCLQSCLVELQLDEHFYQERWPVVEWGEPAVDSRGRPRGCTIVYHREKENDPSRWKRLSEMDRAQPHWREIPPSVRQWSENRFRHVIRVDPYRPDDMQDIRWMAYCFNPCQQDSDCITPNDKRNRKAFVCLEGVCQRNPDYWEAKKVDDRKIEEPEMLLVTGATQGFIGGLKNLVASAMYWAPNHKVVVFNLGDLTKETIARIKSWDNVLAVEWEDGVPAHYPEHVRVGKIYAWKPLVINETLHKYKRSMFWQDAGSTWSGPIDNAEKIIQRTGSFLVHGQDEYMDKSHEATYKYLGFNKHTFEGGPHFAGGIQGWLYPNRYLDTVVRANAECAVQTACICPVGSSLNNHRFDQTTLSILSYHPKRRLPHYTEYLAASSGQLNTDLAKPSYKFIWTARQGCRFYADKMKHRVVTPMLTK